MDTCLPTMPRGGGGATRTTKSLNDQAYQALLLRASRIIPASNRPSNAMQVLADSMWQAEGGVRDLREGPRLPRFVRKDRNTQLILLRVPMWAIDPIAFQGMRPSWEEPKAVRRGGAPDQAAETTAPAAPPAAGRPATAASSSSASSSTGSSAPSMPMVTPDRATQSREAAELLASLATTTTTAATTASTVSVASEADGSTAASSVTPKPATAAMEMHQQSMCAMPSARWPFIIRFLNMHRILSVRAMRADARSGRLCDVWAFVGDRFLPWETLFPIDVDAERVVAEREDTIDVIVRVRGCVPYSTHAEGGPLTLLFKVAPMNGGPPPVAANDCLALTRWFFSCQASAKIDEDGFLRTRHTGDSAARPHRREATNAAAAIPDHVLHATTPEDLSLALSLCQPAPWVQGAFYIHSTRDPHEQVDDQDVKAPERAFGVIGTSIPIRMSVPGFQMHVPSASMGRARALPNNHVIIADSYLSSLDAPDDLEEEEEQVEEHEESDHREIRAPKRSRQSASRSTSAPSSEGGDSEDGTTAESDMDNTDAERSVRRRSHPDGGAVSHMTGTTFTGAENAGAAAQAPSGRRVESHPAGMPPRPRGRSSSRRLHSADRLSSEMNALVAAADAGGESMTWRNVANEPLALNKLLVPASVSSLALARRHDTAAQADADSTRALRQLSEAARSALFETKSSNSATQAAASGHLRMGAFPHDISAGVPPRLTPLTMQHLPGAPQPPRVGPESMMTGVYMTTAPAAATSTEQSAGASRDRWLPAAAYHLTPTIPGGERSSGFLALRSPGANAMTPGFFFSQDESGAATQRSRYPSFGHRAVISAMMDTSPQLGMFRLPAGSPTAPLVSEAQPIRETRARDFMELSSSSSAPLATAAAVAVASSSSLSSSALKGSSQAAAATWTEVIASRPADAQGSLDSGLTLGSPSMSLEGMSAESVGVRTRRHTDASPTMPVELTDSHLQPSATPTPVGAT